MNGADKYGWTPVYAAASKGHLEVVRLLVDQGANIDAATNAGWTPVSAAALNGHLEVA